MKVMNWVKRIGICLVVAIIMPLAAACGNSDTKLVLTTGFERNEIFRIEDVSCSKAEIMVYLTNIQNRYEQVYGSGIWETEIDGVTLEENVKEIGLAKIAQIKAMTLLAQKHNVSLTSEEEFMVKTTADEYYNSLSEKEIEKMGISRDVIVSLYREYALSDKLYHYLIKDINPEISDDEARTITVEHILIKTYSLNEKGDKIEYTVNAKADARQKADDLLQMIKEGGDFEKIALEYSEDENITYSFGKGEMDTAFEEAAFSLGTEEVSNIVETEYGYHIIKCISTFNREATDANKEKIVEQRKEEAFGREYDEFVQTLTKNLNTALWDEVSFIHEKDVDTADFFEIYNKHFRKAFNK